MTDTTLNNVPLFASNARTALANLIEEHPSTRRISITEKLNIIGWLTDLQRRPSTQEEFSRRNYVRKNFVWDEDHSMLFAIDKDDPDHKRTVVLTDEIAPTVEQVHQANGHAGWDATWNDINKCYYGILRSDVIFLLKTCHVCAQNPKKRSKGSIPSPELPERDLTNFDSSEPSSRHL
ncbi:hypothetical protein LTR70_008065 [Exophiala xenobiotica]|uniref:Integrase zinc-binding domain-containing protein n=1 Tax=Lithohypha guttulata TaxID=1690604 RepID=A0ABR0K3R7_9EURO|nr:hypothetical protein LTR24_007182 [Lithohypha guttulata]KAK5312622.1 hypothetical protein LTR70_008065 [Exophiala xenobiotica]